MGEQNINSNNDSNSRAKFISHLLKDIKALDYMLENNLLESSVSRIGAEQEFCLINDNFFPARNALEILEELNDPHFTTELALYNLEFNLDPLILSDDCFSVMEDKLDYFLNKASEVAKKYNTKVLLAGILPTISKTELEIDYLTPLPRYSELNEQMKKLRGSDFHLYISGVDELSLIHDSVMFEACNTSFQTHLQVDPDDFIKSYNWAQAISAPVLAISTNSPILLGRELWHETRIALFQQSIDTRSKSYALREQQARVNFGTDWESGSVSDIFKNDISSHHIILTRDIDSDSFTEIKNGRIPKLQSLSLHNGTIYRWNRPCFGIIDGKANLRIECRYLPSGPTIIDQMANFVFWVALMKGRPEKFDNMSSVMEFQDAKSNFIKAARYGKGTILDWYSGKMTVTDIITNELLPIAWQGLKKLSVNNDDIERFLSIIEQRAKGETASSWQIKNYRLLLNKMGQDDALISLTKALYKNQNDKIPIHNNPALQTDIKHYEEANKVKHIMSSRIITVKENDLAELAFNIMEWKKINHLPVEDYSGNISGILSRKNIENIPGDSLENLSVESVMQKNVIFVHQDTEINEAIKLMDSENIGCLPVIEKGTIVGIITSRDLEKYSYK